MRARTACPLLLLMATATPAPAQSPPPAQQDQLLREPYITGTGATVDKPGEPQGSAPTPLDHKIEKQNNAIDRSICKGC